MTKAKKVLCLVLSVVMIAGVFAFSAFAADQTAQFEVSASATTVSVGDVVTVTVKATTDYYAAATSVPVHYDASVFEFVTGSLTPTDIFGVGATQSAFYNGTGCLTTSLTPLSGVQGVRAQVLNNTTLFTFQLRAIANGTSAIELLAADQKTDSNTGGRLFCGAYATSDVTSDVTIVGQVFTLNNTSVTVGTTAVPELQLSDYGVEIGAVISKNYCTGDTDANGASFDGCVMGIDTLGVHTMDALQDCLTTPAGSIKINTDSTGGMETTGAIIELCDENDEIIERYVFIYFGDVDGDGSLMSGDATLCADFEATWEGLDFEYQQLSADVDGDQSIMSGDATIISDFEATYDPVGSGFVTQAEIAAVYA